MGHTLHLQLPLLQPQLLVQFFNMGLADVQLTAASIGLNEHQNGEPKGDDPRDHQVKARENIVPDFRDDHLLWCKVPRAE